MATVRRAGQRVTATSPDALIIAAMSIVLVYRLDHEPDYSSGSVGLLASGCCPRFDTGMVIPAIVTVARLAVSSVIAAAHQRPKTERNVMNGQQGQRIVLATMMVLGVAAAALGAGQRASAKDAERVSDFGTKAAFEASCEVLGGSFSEDGIGNTNCDADDGGGRSATPMATTAGTPHPIAGAAAGGQGSQIDGTIISAPIVAGSLPATTR